MNARMLCRFIKVTKFKDYCMKIRSQSLCKHNLILNFFLMPQKFVRLKPFHN